VSMETIDLDAYFSRIEYGGDTQADLATLQALHYQHVTHIPFENLNPFLGIPVRLDPAALQAKLTGSRRGGYCYEQNLLFSHVLRALGYEVTGLAARVRWELPADKRLPRTHMLLGVELNDRFYIADTGFGALTTTKPLLLEPLTLQDTSHERVRLLRDREEFILQAELRNEWKALYQFELVEHYQEDYELTSWYLSNHPDSRFVNNLIVSLPAEGCRYTLNNNQFSVYHGTGDVERRRLSEPSEVEEVLAGVFGIDVPDCDRMRQKLAGLLDLAA